MGKGLWQDKVALLFYFLSLIILGYLIFSMLASPFYFQKLGVLRSDQEIVGLRDLPELQSLEVYQQTVNAHPIFGAAKQEVAAASKDPCDDFSQVFSLSGIVQGGQSEAIFLNKRTRQTYFTAAGDSLENVKIQKIQEHSVTIACAGEEKEILIEET